MSDAIDYKNILIITNSYPNSDLSFYGGIFVKNFVDEISRYFDKVMVISQQKNHIGKGLKNYSYKNIDVYYLRYIQLPFSKFDKKVGDNASFVNKLFLKFMSFKPDIIHAHFTWPSGYTGVKLAKEFGIPVAITIHENREWFLEEYNSDNEKIRWTWENANALIRVNKVDIPLLQRFNKNVFSIPNGFSYNRIKILDKIYARRVLNLPNNKKIIFTLGHLIKRKGHRYLISAVKKVVKDYPELLCLIGGDGPLRDTLQKEINSNNLQNNIKLLGPLSDDRLFLWYNSADLFVLPSLSESFGVVQIEAMAVGLPVVATINGGSEEIIISEDYGLLCPPADAECLAENIFIALEKDWDREKIREYARQFTWENIARETLKIYKHLKN